MTKEKGRKVKNAIRERIEEMESELIGWESTTKPEPFGAEDHSECLKRERFLINQLKECREECKARQDLATAYRTGSNKLAIKALDALEKLNS